MHVQLRARLEDVLSDGQLMTGDVETTETESVLATVLVHISCSGMGGGGGGVRAETRHSQTLSPHQLVVTPARPEQAGVHFPLIAARCTPVKLYLTLIRIL